MKTPLSMFFDRWLTVMERAFEQLSAEEFEQLENKIRKEISVSRRNRKKRI